MYKRNNRQVYNTDSLVKNYLDNGGKINVKLPQFGVDKKVDKQINTFYKSIEWKEKRKEILEILKNECAYCGNTNEIHVDHIQPLLFNWELRLIDSNLQILCKTCNFEKGSDYNYHAHELRLSYRKAELDFDNFEKELLKLDVTDEEIKLAKQEFFYQRYEEKSKEGHNGYHHSLLYSIWRLP